MADKTVWVKGRLSWDPVKGLLLTYLMPESCYDEFFLNFNFLDDRPEQMSGHRIILGSVMVKLPQILKLMGAKSAEGLSFKSVLLELLAITGTMAYSIANKFPLGAWGEALFLMLQTVTIGFLIQHYGGRTGRGLLFLVVYFALLGLILSPLTPMVVETGDSLMALTYVISSACNGVITLQVLYYWNSSPERKKKKKKKRE
ncbi:hypothetical protein INR49_020395 [Caranx melampygus]|nr:hypothetical protein INR49_020395 [Caranx melampygus]